MPCDVIFFVARPIQYSYFYNGHFSLRWLTLAAKLLKWHQIQTAKLLTRSKDLLENLSFKFLCVVIFLRCPPNATFLVLRCSILKQMITPGNQTSQITLNLSWNKETLSIFKCNFLKLSLKLLCNVSCTSLPDQSNCFSLTLVNFSQMSSPGSETFQILLY